VCRGTDLTLGDQKEFATGAMYVGIGAGVAAIASTYDMGTPASIGPGFFPFWLGIVLAILGAISLAGSFRHSTTQTRIGAWDLRSSFLVFGAVFIFGFAIDPLGLVVAIALVVVISSLASHEFSWFATAVNAAVISLICLVLFGYGLALQFPLWPAVFAD
jgi:hypothetical protein